MNSSADQPHTKAVDKANSTKLCGTAAMGTGVMIGAGVFALTGQIAELAEQWFPLSFIAGAIVTAFSAYTCIRMSDAFPNARRHRNQPARQLQGVGP